jgi:hypothetical protein
MEIVLGQQARNAALGARRQLIPQPHIGEGTAHHNFMVAAP